MDIFGIFLYLFALFGAISTLTYVIPWFVQEFLFTQQNLKKKYNAEWGKPGHISVSLGFLMA